MFQGQILVFSEAVFSALKLFGLLYEKQLNGILQCIF